MLEKLMVQHGAPTLAGLKTGSLFTVRADTAGAIGPETERINKTLARKGVRLTVMRQGEQGVLLYLYREALLAQCLACPKARSLLRGCGYRNFSVQNALDTLRERLQRQDGFPHEIGLFLGYPLPDVAGFMRNQGQNCLLCGCWKVYGEEEKAMRAFARYHKCTGIYTKKFQTGSSLEKLTVAAKPA